MIGPELRPDDPPTPWRSLPRFVSRWVEHTAAIAIALACLGSGLGRVFRLGTGGLILGAIAGALAGAWLALGWVAVMFVSAASPTTREVALWDPWLDESQIPEDEDPQPPEILVESEDVIGMAVGVEYGVETAHVFAERLLTKVGSGINENGVLVVFEQDGGPSAPVSGIVGGADFAVTADGRHAHGGATAQDGKRGTH